MKYLVPCLIVLLIFLHQDYWQWHDATLDFGFLPRALTFHVVLSIAAAITWAMAVRWCWPRGVDAAADAAAGDESARETGK